MNHTLYLDRHGLNVGFSKQRLTLRSHDEEERTLPIETIDMIVVLGHTHFSHSALAALLKRDIPVLFSSSQGGYRGCLTTRPGRQIRRRQRQLDASRDVDQRLIMARALVQAKLRGQARLLGQWGVAARSDVIRSLRATGHCNDLDRLRGHEGSAARAFFEGLRVHLEGSGFRFERRQYHPPPDPVNATLSLLYTLLHNEVEVGVAATGLDAAGGFFHAIDDGRPSLLMDLVEPLRPLADRLASRLLRRHLEPEDFDTQEGICRLRDGHRGVVYQAWETLLDTEVSWRNEHTSWRRVIHHQAREVAQWLDGHTVVPRFWYLDDTRTGRHRRDREMVGHA